MSALLTLALSGCAWRGNVEMLESELRRQEQAQQELNEALASAREELRVARADSVALRQQLSSVQQVSLGSEQAEVLYRANAIKFNMLLTSGMDRDGQPGDEALSVLVIPVDEHGDLVKLAGAIELELFDLTLPQDRQRVGHWNFDIEQAREHWHKGFLAAGYLFQLDWQQPPQSQELTLHARLLAPDARRFEATTQIRLTPPVTEVPPPIAHADYRESRRPAPVGHARYEKSAAEKPAPRTRPSSSTSRESPLRASMRPRTTNAETKVEAKKESLSSSSIAPPKNEAPLPERGRDRSEVLKYESWVTAPSRAPLESTSREIPLPPSAALNGKRDREEQTIKQKSAGTIRFAQPKGYTPPKKAPVQDDSPWELRNPDAEPPAERTSDSWTEETIPRLR